MMPVVEAGGWDNPVDGLTLKNLTFTEDILLGSTSHNNISIENCEFTNNARIHQNNNVEKVTNLVVSNCSFTGNGDGTVTALMLENADGVTVKNCSFKDIQFNVLQCGTIANLKFDNNTINGTGDRVFRFVNVSNNLTISNNTIISDGDADGQLAKTQYASTINLSGNTWNGLSDAEVADKLININK